MRTTTVSLFTPSKVSTTVCFMSWISTASWAGSLWVLSVTGRTGTAICCRSSSAKNITGGAARTPQVRPMISMPSWRQIVCHMIQRLRANGKRRTRPILIWTFTGINLQTVRYRELPDCYSFYITIIFDNQCHSGKVKLFLDIDVQSSACQNWKISGTAEKNTHYLLLFDGFVIIVCLTSAVLCTRSIVLAVRLLQRFSRFFRENYNRKVCEDDQNEFLNGWYVLVIVSDLLAIIGSILKVEIQAKSLTSYDVCSIFLGTSTLMVWVGVIRYLGYFQKYNVLILTMKAAFPKVLRFCCCAGMIYLGYTFCGWIVLGPYHEKFEGLSRVAECLFSLLNGDDMFTTFAQLKDKNTLVWLFSRAYLYSFISLFIYMVLSLFIALITDAYETIKRFQKDGFPPTDLQKFLREQKDFPVAEEASQTDMRIRSSLLCCCPKIRSASSANMDTDQGGGGCCRKHDLTSLTTSRPNNPRLCRITECAKCNKKTFGFPFK
ncbi:mucolipin-2 isoform 6-T8 [Spinachia spinachia]